MIIIYDKNCAFPENDWILTRVCGNLIIAVCWYGEVEGDYV